MDQTSHWQPGYWDTSPQKTRIIQEPEKIVTRLYLASKRIKVQDTLSGDSQEITEILLPPNERLFLFVDGAYGYRRFVTEPMEDRKPRILKVYVDQSLIYVVREWKQ